MAGPTVTDNPTVILSEELIEFSTYMEGETPGSEPSDPGGGVFGGQTIKPPVAPKTLLAAVASDGQLAAVMHAASEGCAGVKYTIKPRFETADPTDRTTWPEGAEEQRHLMQIFIQTGFRGRA